MCDEQIGCTWMMQSMMYINRHFT